MAEQSRHGVRARGSHAHRLETFVDAAFAFALTLLVISFDEVPATYEELVLALRGIPAFAASFAIIVMLWIGHSAWSRTYGLRDGLSQLISIVLVFVVMIYVYPLRAMMSGAIGHMSGGWAPGTFEVNSIEQVRGLFTIYGVGFAASVGCIVLLYFRALMKADELDLSAYERAATRSGIAVWSLVAGMGVLSIVLSNTLPDRLLPLAAWSYSLLGVLAPALGIWLGRRVERRFGAG